MTARRPTSPFVENHRDHNSGQSRVSIEREVIPCPGHEITSRRVLGGALPSRGLFDYSRPPVA